MITQRPQSVNKEVLNQTECLFCFQVNGAHERKAIKDWILHQGMDTVLVNELPALKPGQCWVWSPQWLNVLKKIIIAEKTTFDSTSTPKVGGTFRGKTLEPLDIESLREKMKATIEKQKADDPRELRKQIAELKKLLDKPKTAVVQEKPKEVHVLGDKQIERLEKALELSCGRHQEILAAIKLIKVGVATGNNFERRAPVVKNEVKSLPVVKTGKAFEHNSDTNGFELGKCERQILKFLAMRSGHAYSKVQIGAMTNYSPNSGGFNNAISKLCTQGLVVKHGSVLQCNGVDAAKQILGSEYMSPETGGLEQWLNKLGKCSREIYQQLLKTPEQHYSKQELADLTGYSVGSGGFNNSISQLSTLGLLDRQNGMISLSQEIQNL